MSQIPHMNPYTVVAEITTIVDTKYDDNDCPHPVLRRTIETTSSHSFRDLHEKLQRLESYAADMGDGFSNAKVLAVYDQNNDNCSLPTDSREYEYAASFGGSTPAWKRVNTQNTIPGMTYTEEVECYCDECVSNHAISQKIAQDDEFQREMDKQANEDFMSENDLYEAQEAFYEEEW